MESKKKVISKSISNMELRIILKKYGTSLVSFTEYIHRSRSYFHNTIFLSNGTVPLVIVDKLIEFIGADNYNSIYEDVVLPRRNDIIERELKLKEKKMKEREGHD